MYASIEKAPAFSSLHGFLVSPLSGPPGYLWPSSPGLCPDVPLEWVDCVFPVFLSVCVPTHLLRFILAGLALCQADPMQCHVLVYRVYTPETGLPAERQGAHDRIPMYRLPALPTRPDVAGGCAEMQSERAGVSSGNEWIRDRISLYPRGNAAKACTEVAWKIPKSKR